MTGDPTTVPTREQERERLERELANLRASRITLEGIGPEHREIVAHTLNEMIGWSAERMSLAQHERRSLEVAHWRETYRWLSALLSTIPGRHLATFAINDPAAFRPCWCPIGIDHRPAQDVT